MTAAEFTATGGNVGGQVIWIEGNATISVSGGTIASRENPIILVVNGDAEMAANHEFYGILYVAGDFKTTGNTTIYGSSIIEGEVTQAGGNPSFVFDPLITAGGDGTGVGWLGQRGMVSGTWRDWSM